MKNGLIIDQKITEPVLTTNEDLVDAEPVGRAEDGAKVHRVLHRVEEQPESLLVLGGRFRIVVKPLKAFRTDQNESINHWAI